MRLLEEQPSIPRRRESADNRYVSRLTVMVYLGAIHQKEKTRKGDLFMLKKLSLTVTVVLLAFTSVSFAQTLQTLVHQPPNGAYLPFLLTDVTVMFQGNNSATWSKLTPDNFGSYLNGTWSQLDSLPSGYSPDDFASSVLADGRVVIVGGE